MNGKMENIWIWSINDVVGIVLYLPMIVTNVFIKIWTNFYDIFLITLYCLYLFNSIVVILAKDANIYTYYTY
jgi:hypothetical protein